MIYENKYVFWAISAYVVKEYRKVGVLFELSEKARSHAKERNVPIVKIFVEKSNFKAIKAYEKIGFKNTHELFYGYDFVFSNHKKRLRLG